MAFSGLAAANCALISVSSDFCSSVWCWPAWREVRISARMVSSSAVPATVAATPACHEIEKAMPR